MRAQIREVLIAALVLGLSGAAASPSAHAGLAADDGFLDPSFSGDGKKTVQVGDLDEATAVAFGADGSIFAVGTSFYGDERGDSDLVVIKLRANGSLDPSFGGDGIVLYGDPSAEYAERGEGVAVQLDGSVLAVGTSSSPSGELAFLMLRFAPDGSLDGSFGGGDGVVWEDRSIGNDAWTDVIVLSDGKIIVCGETSSDDPYQEHLYVARYRSNGRLDPTFGTDGETVLGFGIRSTYVAGCDLDGNDAILVGGSHTAFLRLSVFLARVTSSGQLDASFGGGDGLFDRNVRQVGGATDVAVLDDDSIILSSTDDAMTAIRIRRSGRRDKSFGGDGRAQADFPEFSRAYSMVTTADRIVLAGFVGSTSGEYDNDIALAAYSLEGELDEAFGEGGTIQTSILRQDRAMGIGIQPDGRLVVAGAAGRWLGVPPRQFAFARYVV